MRNIFLLWPQSPQTFYYKLPILIFITIFFPHIWRPQDNTRRMIIISPSYNNNNNFVAPGSWLHLGLLINDYTWYFVFLYFDTITASRQQRQKYDLLSFPWHLTYNFHRWWVWCVNLCLSITYQYWRLSSCRFGDSVKPISPDKAETGYILSVSLQMVNFIFSCFVWYPYRWA